MYVDPNFLDGGYVDVILKSLKDEKREADLVVRILGSTENVKLMFLVSVTTEGQTSEIVGETLKSSINTFNQF